MMKKNDIKLSEHFTLQELCHSRTAERQQLPNTPLPCHVMRLKNLCVQVLEPVRRHVGQPVLVTSGYRCEAVNRLVGGVPSSQHRLGLAADFVLKDGGELRPLWEWMQQHVPYGQLILEQKGRKEWIHVSCHIDQRQNRRRAFVISKP
ncbi:MAG: peptidase M15 [Prevotella sp.]|nr:peptidase M15 [Prevotella sp.]